MSLGANPTRGFVCSHGISNTFGWFELRCIVSNLSHHQLLAQTLPTFAPNSPHAPTSARIGPNRGRVLHAPHRRPGIELGTKDY